MKVLALVFKIIAALVLIFIIAPIAYCQLTKPTYRWHQKLTISITTPDGARSGSSVTAVKTTFDQIGKRWHSGIKGEAVVVDLPDETYLFGLLSAERRSCHMCKIAQLILKGRRESQNDEALLEDIAAGRGRADGRITVPEKFYPLLVTFDDLSDPASVKEVDPNDLSATFGPGYSLKSITLEITNAPVTTGKVEQVLPCLLSGKACVPLNKELPYGHPMRNILNSYFWRN